MLSRKSAILVLVGAIGLQASTLPAAPAAVDLSKAVVVTAGAAADPIERQAAEMLRWEVRKRTDLDLRLAAALPAPEAAAIVIGSRERMPALPEGAALPPPPMKDGDLAAEGYVLTVDTTARPAPTVYAIGNDRRGALFAVGRLLRALERGDGTIACPGDLSISTAPAYPIRGMQLGYRRKTDAFDAWDAAQYGQYIRDLICFGNNSIELIPALYPGSTEPANPDPLNPVSPWDHTITISALCGAYDMDVWMWIPLESGYAADPVLREASLREREALFAACQRIDHIFVPGGDPGDTPSPLLMPYLTDLAVLLRRHHPLAGMWVSPQGFSAADREHFYHYLASEQPEWLTGVVHGPGVRGTPGQVREMVPAQYAIRQYPDITHVIRCQYPIISWDRAWARTYERQPIQPRPRWSQMLCTMFSAGTQGALAYSDSISDDVNKIVWNALLWDPQADLREVLRDYGRVFVGPEFADEIADGILMIEDNWEGAAISNPQVPRALAHYQALERRAGPRQMGSWRFQTQLIRAYGDAYVQTRLQRDTALLERAYAELRKAPQVGVEQAMAAAEEILKQSDPLAAAPALSDRIEELAALVFRTIGMQLSIEKYGASSIDRGALLDSIYRPVTDIPWVLEQFARVRAMASEQEQLAWLRRVADWEDAGPGGFYDDLGNHVNHKNPRLVQPPGLPVVEAHWGGEAPETGRLSWNNTLGAGTSPEYTIRLRYEGLEPEAAYLLRVVYAAVGRFAGALQLYFNGEKFGEPFVQDPRKNQEVEYEVPRSATADGTLEVMWLRTAGRSPSIGEVWLIRR